MKIRVYYEDTDAGGIVYHTNYIKYCERARSEIFFQRGVKPTLGENSGFVVRDIKASFLATAVLGDILEVTTKILTMKRSSVVLLQEVWKKDVKLFSMEVVLVYVEEGKPCRIPEEFEDIFKAF
ncbi:YbgC/FadM family acyl-CoA thioesterase [Sulfurovum sp. XGS-02]|uniref:YbgC/FadM family acyl-CoA thioesterase n=1 Tax=Sulfurovum sp. XGS-02 TaxID=2925411 RepID=UPI00204DC314|nr:YbgC/FadM family acyl-CoA thioesterase [Sulfurovum sp. XGS-02]UPT78228.1 YbgC/FadM family acyl-CoA thioesterase [Sulfurovum sp. XGS-02]